MIRIVPYRRGGWEYDIRTRAPNGEKIRERRKSPVASRSGSLRWAQDRERELLIRASAAPNSETPRPPVPTLKEFYPRFLREYPEAERHKPSGIAAKRTILKVHLVPLLGSMPLDQIGPAAVQKVKVALKDRKPKTVNNVLSVLHTLLTKALEWEVIADPPCRMRLLHCESPEKPFWDFHELERLISCARETGWREYLAVLLGAKAGLRCGELMALAWTDVDLRRQPQRLTVRTSEWKGHVTETKGRKVRRIPVGAVLAAALMTHRHLRSERVLCCDDGKPLTQKMVRTVVQRVERRAGLHPLGVHALRHTFCSHLAMRGATLPEIMKLAGHVNPSTTMVYMHLSPAAEENAIQKLDEPAPWGDLGETAEGHDAK
ncbi:MAG: site-specific integrase [Candidatus Eisenbacteria sp.]|nr:site-specific integrase [Candidatus Eisenbacteria bacterium]